MEFRVLQYFLAIVREENISRAAEILHVTQPTLSRQMTQLEEELGCQLFIRGKHLVLTDAGVMLRKRAEEVVSLVDKIETEFDQKSELGGTISIGSGGLMAMQSLSHVMNEFKMRYPSIQYEFYTNNAEYVKEKLEQGLLDFGLLLEPIDVTKFDYIRMKEKEKWGIFMRKDCSLATLEHITAQDLYKYPLIISDRLSIQKELETWLGAPINQLDIFMTFNIVTNIVSFVESGYANALVIEGSVNHFDPDKFVFRPLFPELSLSSVLAWKKFQHHLGASAQFIDFYKSIQ